MAPLRYYPVIFLRGAVPTCVRLCVYISVERLTLSQDSECQVTAEATTTILQPVPGMWEVLKQHSFLDLSCPLPSAVRPRPVGCLQNPH